MDQFSRVAKKYVDKGLIAGLEWEIRHFNKIVSGLDGDGKTLTLGSVEDVSGINEGSTLSGVSTSSSFRIKVPRITNLDNSGIYSKLPRKNISNIIKLICKITNSR